VNPWPRRVLKTTLTLTLALATLAGVVVAGAVVTARSTHQPVPARSTPAAAASRRSTEPGSVAGNVSVQHGRRLVVAFVVGKGGTIASDLLAPYDIFASSPAFTAYVVAADAGPAPLEGGPAVVPTYTFAEVDAHPALTPDLVVVPALTRPTGSSEAPLRRWVTGRHDDGAKVLGVCSGSLVLAATGMLDGLHATSHWSRIKALEASRPAVHWVRGRRYVEDGAVTTTAAVTSGVPAALHLVAELAGPAEAQRVAELHPELGWSPDTSTVIDDDHFTVPDWPVGLNYVLPWFRPTVGIALREGVGELDATAAFEVYGQSAAAATVALATDDSVRTQHGLVLLTTPVTHAPDLTRLLVPGAGRPDALDPRLRAWADHRHLAVETLAGRAGPDGPGSGGGFTAALQNLADHTDTATTRATAKMVGYPTAGLNLDAPHRSWRTVLLGILGLALALLVGWAPVALARHRGEPPGTDRSR
jgi:putative intracellular protease/amidase